MADRRKSMVSMFGLGMPELILILLIILVIFGAGKLPEVGGALGKGIRNFRKSFKGSSDEIDITPEKEPDKIEDQTKS
jgi:sec-independent protein translocase protein TatA